MLELQVEKLFSFSVLPNSERHFRSIAEQKNIFLKFGLNTINPKILDRIKYYESKNLGQTKFWIKNN